MPSDSRLPVCECSPMSCLPWVSYRRGEGGGGSEHFVSGFFSSRNPPEIWRDPRKLRSSGHQLLHLLVTPTYTLRAAKCRTEAEHVRFSQALRVRHAFPFRIANLTMALFKPLPHTAAVTRGQTTSMLALPTVKIPFWLPQYRLFSC